MNIILHTAQQNIFHVRSEKETNNILLNRRGETSLNVLSKRNCRRGEEIPRATRDGRDKRRETTMTHREYRVVGRRATH